MPVDGQECIERCSRDVSARAAEGAICTFIADEDFPALVNDERWKRHKVECVQQDLVRDVLHGLRLHEA